MRPQCTVPQHKVSTTTVLSVCSGLILALLPSGCSDGGAGHSFAFSEYKNEGPAKTIERQLDDNKDGRFESWQLISWPGCPHQIIATCIDDDQNSVMDYVSADISKTDFGGPDTMQLRDLDGDGKFDSRMVWLRMNGRNQAPVDHVSGMVYEDFNLDGIFDTFLNIDQNERHVLYGQRWESTTDGKVDFGLREGVITIEKQTLEVAFRTDRWEGK